MLPFVWVSTLWTSGVAGSIAGMLAYVLGSLGIFRLVNTRSRAACQAYLAAANLRAQSQPAVHADDGDERAARLAFFIWAIVCFDEFLRAVYPPDPGHRCAPQISPQKALEGCGIAIAGGADPLRRVVLRSHHGRPRARCVCAVVGVQRTQQRRRDDEIARRVSPAQRAGAGVLAGLQPSRLRNALDCANGPYSARAIAERTTAKRRASLSGQRPHRHRGLVLLEGGATQRRPRTSGDACCCCSQCRDGVVVWRCRRSGICCCCGCRLRSTRFPLPMAACRSYIPTWWPFSYYNVRYGLQLLPVFAVFPVVLGRRTCASGRRHALKWRRPGCLAAVVGASYLGVCGHANHAERSRGNSRDRNRWKMRLARTLIQLPPNATLLMYQAEHVGALQQAGIPLSHVISETSHPDWEWALLDPASTPTTSSPARAIRFGWRCRLTRSDFESLFPVSAPWQANCTVYKPKPTAVPH